MKKMIAFFALVMLIGNLSGCVSNNENKSTGKNNNKNQNSTSNNQNNKNQNSTSNNDNSSSNKEMTPPKTNLATIKEYFPMKKNTRYIYEGEGNEFASYDVYNDYISGNKVQQRMNNGGTARVKVLELNGGKLSRVYSKGEAYYRENQLNKNDG